MSALLTVQEVADELRVDKSSVYRLIHSGDLPATNISTGKRPRIRIRREALTKFIKSREGRSAA